VLSDKFVAGGIIAKLPPSWRDFATSLKHKRQEFRVAKLIGSLDVEERARAKNTRGKDVESSSANMLPKKNSNASRNKKKNSKEENNLKPKQTTTFKKKNNNKYRGCFVCGVMSIGQVRAQTTNLSKRRNLQTWLLARLKEEHLGMVILYLLFF